MSLDYFLAGGKSNSCSTRPEGILYSLKDLEDFVQMRQLYSSAIVADREMVIILTGGESNVDPGGSVPLNLIAFPIKF